MSTEWLRAARCSVASARSGARWRAVRALFISRSKDASALDVVAAEAGPARTATAIATGRAHVARRKTMWGTMPPNVAGRLTLSGDFNAFNL